MATERLFLTISAGETAQDARPILATSDQGVVKAVAREISKRLGLDKPVSVLRKIQPVKEGQ
jgi:hypothetical protein